MISWCIYDVYIYIFIKYTIYIYIWIYIYIKITCYVRESQCGVHLPTKLSSLSWNILVCIYIYMYRYVTVIHQCQEVKSTIHWSFPQELALGSQIPNLSLPRVQVPKCQSLEASVLNVALVQGKGTLGVLDGGWIDIGATGGGMLLSKNSNFTSLNLKFWVLRYF